MLKITEAITKVRKKGFWKTVEYLKNRIRTMAKNLEDDAGKIKILLLTNRDSDNVGDQVIEACDIGLIEAVMNNLDVKEDEYVILSRAASIISKQYLSMKDPKLLTKARNLIQKSDLVLFGGAPMFNYLYQNFYERTAVILELAEEYGKPVIFSAIGIERYDENNEKCQRLKKTLNFSCVKQITTRDGYPLLLQYRDNDQIAVGKVSDPAVFSSAVFRNHVKEKETSAKKKIGLFILRANGFVDNQIPFTKEDAAAFWLDLIQKLEKKGYDYELLTSGHFGDEAFLNFLIRNYGVSNEKCVFNMNSPELLIQKISSYHAIISCRLHPSIIAFALDVPSLGIVWNTKVEGFYESIGYKSRIIDIMDITPDEVADKIEDIICGGVDKREEYVRSVYDTLFRGIQGALYPDRGDIQPFTYARLIENIPSYEGTSVKEQEKKIERKFERIYKTFEDRYKKNQNYKEKIETLLGRSAMDADAYISENEYHAFINDASRYQKILREGNDEAVEQEFRRVYQLCNEHLEKNMECQKIIKELERPSV